MARRGGKSEARVDLLGVVDLLQEVLTKAACDSVFRQTRVTERVRAWTLKALLDFWTAVTLRAPKSLRSALQEAQAGPEGGWPTVPATSAQAFFERCKGLRWEFFAGLFRAFVERVVPRAKPVFAHPVADLERRFGGLWAIDGSKLDAVAHRLKILWNTRSAVLPGCLEVLYDLVRGIPRVVHFDPDAAKAELVRAYEVIESVPAGVLVLGDRLYCSAKVFARLGERDAFGIFRVNPSLGVRKVRRLGKIKHRGGVVEDWLVEAGSGQTAPVQTLRWIVLRIPGKKPRQILTSVLDPTLLTAEEAVDLYPFRWRIERMFFDLKQVLDLHSFYAGNPNAVAMQVYAAALVYTALRVAQGKTAHKARIDAEEISVPKLFPRVASAACTWTTIQITVAAMQEANPNVELKSPNWRRMPFASAPLSAVRVEHRSPKRRKRRYCVGRRRWKSLAHICGGPSLIRGLS
ncbi:MAG: IS4 family transposase [Planctomycetota bacterium]|jgi:hypothetical protein